MSLFGRLADVFLRRKNGVESEHIDKLEQKSDAVLVRAERAARAAGLIHDARRMDDRLSGRDR